ncbi:uncharacterized protein LOC135156591 [Lytechinus pictus]|uniref:uncharacterized protein LOC135156591 n=1 Tax=Lytechinus pictus TaxID=7653 RepID=UPI0030BA0A88
MPLTDLLRNRKKRSKKPLDWSPACTAAFVEVKEKLAQITVLAYPNSDYPLSLMVDASDRAIGGVIQQLHDNAWEPIAFFSRKLLPAETRVDSVRKPLQQPYKGPYKLINLDIYIFPLSYNFFLFSFFLIFLPPDNDIDIHLLPDLNEDSIKELIPKIGKRIKFTKGWREEFKQPATSPASTVSLGEGFELSDSADTSSDQHDWQADDHIAPQRKGTKTVTYFLRPILSSVKGGPRIIKDIDKHKFCSKPNRRILVDICTQYVMQHHGEKPSSGVKAAMASAIITAFPCLRDPDSPYGYEAWYCQGAKGRPATGYLEEHLRYLRKRTGRLKKTESAENVASSAEKQIVKPMPTETQSSEPSAEDQGPPEVDKDTAAKIEWLKHNKQPREQVVAYMKETVMHRQKWIKAHRDNISTILAEYPHMMQAEMVEQDFKTFHEGKENGLYIKWPQYKEQIIQYANRSVLWKAALHLDGIDAERLNPEEKTNLALVLLPAILRGRKAKGGVCTVQETLDSFIDVQPEVVNIEEFMKSIDGQQRSQPFIMARGSKINPAQTYVIVERHAIETASLLAAVDVAFKSTFVFDVDYQRQCCQVWHFLQSVVYGMGDVGANITPKIRDLRAFLATKDIS